MATGDVVLVLRSGAAFDALTGQEWILQVADLEREARLLLSHREVPRQQELTGPPPANSKRSIAQTRDSGW